MKHSRRFDRDDGEWLDRDDRQTRRAKGRDRRRMSEAEAWAGLEESAPEAPREEAPARPQRRPAPRMDPSATVELKGFAIDLSRVDSISPAETVHEGRPSSGIRFEFSGGKGLGRTVWYGRDRALRDSELARCEAIRAEAEARKGGAR